MNNLLDCKHTRRHFIKSGQWINVGRGSGREHVHVCEDCGQIQIFVHQNDETVNLALHIHDRDVVESMLKWVDFVEGRQESAEASESEGQGVE